MVHAFSLCDLNECSPSGSSTAETADDDDDDDNSLALRCTCLLSESRTTDESACGADCTYCMYAIGPRGYVGASALRLAFLQRLTSVQHFQLRRRLWSGGLTDVQVCCEMAVVHGHRFVKESVSQSVGQLLLGFDSSFIQRPPALIRPRWIRRCSEIQD